MKKRDIVLIVILSFGAIAVLFALAAYLYMRRRRRKREDDEDGTSCAIRVDQSSESGGKSLSRLNGFLNLKTPLISTKTLGNMFATCLRACTMQHGRVSNTEKSPSTNDAGSSF